MKLDEEQALLAAAAAPILEQIRDDREATIPPLKPLLRHLEDHLFDPDLDAEGWLHMSVFTTDVLREIFRRQLGVEAEAYFWDRRLHTASLLLRDTRLSITAIGEMVGFSGRQAYSDAFKEWLGERPTTYKREAGDRVARYGLPPEWMLSEVFLQRLEAGRLTAEEADAVRKRLEHVRDAMTSEHGRHEDSGSPQTAPDDNEDRCFEELMALKLWQKIERLPFKEQKLFVANQMAYTTTALRDLLLKFSDAAEGSDHQRLEHLAPKQARSGTTSRLGPFSSDDMSSLALFPPY